MDRFRRDGERERLLRAGSIALCILLAVFMAGFLKWNADQDAKESQRLEQLKEEAEQESAGEAESTEDTAPDAESSGSTPAPDTAEEGDAAAEEEEASDGQQGNITAVAVWGNDLLMGNGTAEQGCAARLQEQLNAQGYAVTVENWLLDSKSTLSIMKYAGVPDADIQAYITAHQAAGAAAGSPEVSVRSFTAEELAREKNPEAMPVLVTGYYGGWNGNTAELIEQQRKILAALQTGEKPCLVVGISPSGDAEGKAAYDAAMQEAWGGSYVSAGALTNAPESPEGQQELAALAADALIRMGVLKKGA